MEKVLADSQRTDRTTLHARHDSAGHKADSGAGTVSNSRTMIARSQREPTSTPNSSFRTLTELRRM